MNVYSIICKSQKLETAQFPTADEWISNLWWMQVQIYSIIPRNNFTILYIII